MECYLSQEHSSTGRVFADAAILSNQTYFIELQHRSPVCKTDGKATTTIFVI